MLDPTSLGTIQNLRYPLWVNQHGLGRLQGSRSPSAGGCCALGQAMPVSPPEQTPQQQSLKILHLPGHRIHIGVAVHLPVQQSVV